MSLKKLKKCPWKRVRIFLLMQGINRNKTTIYYLIHKIFRKCPWKKVKIYLNRNKNIIVSKKIIIYRKFKMIMQHLKKTMTQVMS